MKRRKRGNNPLNPSTRRRDSAPLPEESLLPACHGPKLHSFKHASPSIQFERLLNPPIEPSSSDSSSTSGGDGYVFKALIDSKLYAIKLFKFFDIAISREEFGDSVNRRMPDEEFVANKDPFYAECRAYGLIEEFNRRQRHRKSQETIAVPCHGYILISQAEEARIENQTQHHHLNWRRSEQDIGKPIRAIVKDFVPGEPVNTKVRSIRRMVTDLRRLHQIGIYVMDVCERNYRGGLLVDFGSAHTEPSCVLREVPEWIARTDKMMDFADFDDMIKELGVKTSVRAWKDETLEIRTRAQRKRSRTSDKLVELDASGKKARTVV
ncbi:MAG: hypothetical protein Q9165_008307 [Trypethelium subeluteriae]